MNSWLMQGKLIGLDIFQLINIYGMLMEDRTENFLLSILASQFILNLDKNTKKKKLSLILDSGHKLQICHRKFFFHSRKFKHECFDINSVCSQRRSAKSS